MDYALVWFRRDLRLADNPALQAALDTGHVPVPVFIHAPDEEGDWPPGAASSSWLHHSLLELDRQLQALGSRLVIRCGPTLTALESLLAETGAKAVYWNRLYEPAISLRDTRIKAALATRGIEALSFNAALLVEPWSVATADGKPYRVFTPFWRNALQRVESRTPQAAPVGLPPLDPTWGSLPLADLQLLPKIRWDAGFYPQWQPGEQGAHELLEAFAEGASHGYKEQRNFPDRVGSSKLSPHLHFGEISPAQVLSRLRLQRSPPIPEADLAHFASELGWREFAHHLLFHFPYTPDTNLSPRFEKFQWAPVDSEALQRWQQGNTGVPIVDAGMRELWRTGWMHNRVRMVTASFLTRNLRYDWRVGARWFWNTLVDADLANNTQGWQWSAGTGADAAPYFRIFSPVAQSERFDRRGAYIRRWVPELASLPDNALFAPWQNPTVLSKLAPDYPSEPMLDLKATRDAALQAYQQSR